MKKFMDKARSHVEKYSDKYPGAQQQQQQPIRQQDGPSSVQAPTAADVMRYRYQHSTNLGAIYVLEKWLFGSMFVDGAKGGSELDAVQACLKKSGLDATRQKWEQHWASAVTNDDWNWLVEASCTTIRLPIGYFTLGPDFCKGTPFDGKISQVYANGWSSVKSFVAAAYDHGIGVLIDLHALPGGANGDEHSGTTSGKAGLWGSKQNLALSQSCLTFIAQESCSMPGVVGIQLCNEAVWDAPGMYQWYDNVIGAIGQIDSSMPIIISDAWNLSSAVSYSNAKNNFASNSNPIVIDTHRYYCFSDQDKQQTPQQIISRVSGELGELNGHEGDVSTHGAAQVIIDEYSCVLDGQTWGKVSSGDRDTLVRQFGQAESKQWQARAGGSAFWTLKMDWMDGGEWGFKQQTNGGAISAPPNLKLSSDDVNSRLSTAQAKQAELKNAASSSHRNYWSQTSPGQDFEFWRFDSGYDIGYADVLGFFAMRAQGGLKGSGGDKIGMLDLWVRKRLFESGQAGQYVWEFEQGLRQAIGDCYNAMGI